MHTTSGPRSILSLRSTLLLALVVIASGSCGGDSGPTPPEQPTNTKLRVFADLTGTGASALQVQIGLYGDASALTDTLASVDSIVDRTIEVPVGAGQRVAISTIGPTTFGTALVKDIGPDVTETSVLTLTAQSDLRQFSAEIGSVVVEVQPGNSTVPMGSSVQLSATIVDTTGARTTGPVQWSTGWPDVATVNSTGLVTGQAAGRAMITATIGELSGHAYVQATDTAPPPVIPPQTGDRTPPTLTAFSLGPDTVDVTNDSAVVTMTFVVSDSGSGVASVHGSVAIPGGHGDCIDPARVSGSSAAGTWECQLHVAHGGAPGAWPVTSITATDLTGNGVRLATPPDSTHPDTLWVLNSRADTSAPLLGGVTFTPDTLDFHTSASNLSVTVNIKATDAESGVDAVFADFVGPNGELVFCNPAHLVSGSMLDGTWACSVTLSPSATPGTWRVQEVELTNPAGVHKTYVRASIDSSGFATTFEVIGGTTVDRTPPALLGLTLDPDTVDVSADSAVVTAHFTASDAGSGVAAVSMTLSSLGGARGYSCEASQPESGTPANGTWSCRITIPYLSEGGQWFGSAELTDGAGNINYPVGPNLYVISRAP